MKCVSTLCHSLYFLSTAQQPLVGRASLLSRLSDHIQLHTEESSHSVTHRRVGRTPLDE